jgi:hypothetical protein
MDGKGSTGLIWLVLRASDGPGRESSMHIKYGKLSDLLRNYTPFKKIAQYFRFPMLFRLDYSILVCD